MMAKHVKAFAIGGRTCLGSSGTFPREHGNCFDLLTENGKSYRIVNFIAENFDYLRKKGLKWPVQMAILDGSNAAALNDPRIGDRWFQDRYCEVCCPTELLPLPQILRHRRMECWGEREGTGEGWVKQKMISTPQFQ